MWFCVEVAFAFENRPERIASPSNLIEVCLDVWRQRQTEPVEEAALRQFHTKLVESLAGMEVPGLPEDISRKAVTRSVGERFVPFEFLRSEQCLELLAVGLQSTDQNLRGMCAIALDEQIDKVDRSRLPAIVALITAYLVESEETAKTLEEDVVGRGESVGIMRTQLHAQNSLRRIMRRIGASGDIKDDPLMKVNKIDHEFDE